jgi:hypothetical protein
MFGKRWRIHSFAAFADGVDVFLTCAIPSGGAGTTLPTHPTWNPWYVQVLEDGVEGARLQLDETVHTDH